MAEHPNATVVREMNQAMANGDIEGAASRVADDVVWHEIGRAEPRRGKAELAASMGEFEGDRKIVYRTAEIYHVRNGQVAERWAFSDDTKAITDFFA